MAGARRGVMRILMRKFRGQYAYPAGMEPHVVGDTEAQRPSRLWVVLLVLAVAIAVAVLVYLLPRRHGAVQDRSVTDMIVDRVQDINGLRYMAGSTFFATTSNKAMPMARDGRIDIYALLETSDNTRDELVQFCFSARAGKGPSRAEFDAGDYTNFPYQRRRGAPDLKTPEGALIVWEREPRNGERLVALANGAVQTWDEERMQRFFRENPGQE